MFRIICTLSFLLILPIQTNAETETQTTWSNPGVYGPLGAWGNNYYFSTNLTTSSSLALEFGSINSIDPELLNPMRFRRETLTETGKRIQLQQEQDA